MTATSAGTRARRPAVPQASQPAAARAMTTAVLSRRVGAAGICADTRDDSWYPEFGSRRSALARYARRQCAGCCVIWECLELALRIESTRADASWGIWGATAPHERQALLRKRASAAVQAAACPS